MCWIAVPSNIELLSAKGSWDEVVPQGGTGFLGSKPHLHWCLIPQTVLPYNLGQAGYRCIIPLEQHNLSAGPGWQPLILGLLGLWGWRQLVGSDFLNQAILRDLGEPSTQGSPIVINVKIPNSRCHPALSPTTTGQTGAVITSGPSDKLAKRKQAGGFKQVIYSRG